MSEWWANVGDRGYWKKNRDFILILMEAWRREPTFSVTDMHFPLFPSSATFSTHICIKPGFRNLEQGIAIGTIGLGALGAAYSWRGNIFLGIFPWSRRIKDSGVVKWRAWLIWADQQRKCLWSLSLEIKFTIQTLCHLYFLILILKLMYCMGNSLLLILFFTLPLLSIDPKF